MHALTTLFASLPLVAVPLASASSAPRALVQDEGGEKQDEREDVAELIKTFKDHIKRKAEEDVEAIAVIDTFVRQFEEYGPKDREDVVKAIEGAFKVKRPKELEEGVPDERLHFAAATALKEMAPESVKPLISALGGKTFRSSPRILGRIALSLGETQDERGIDPLVDLIDDKDMEIQAKAAEALGNYGGVDLDTRKEIFKELLDILVGQKTKVDNSPTDQEAFERWSMISGPFVASMQALSGHDEREAEAWQRWWNKNKKEDWDA